MTLSADDIRFILESLNYTKKAFSEYTDYPSYEFKQKRIAEADAVIAKVWVLHDAQKAEAR